MSLAHEFLTDDVVPSLQGLEILQGVVAKIVMLLRMTRMINESLKDEQRP